MKQIITLLTAIFLVSSVYGQSANEYYNRGISKDDLQYYLGAIADFNKAIELNPNNANSYYYRGNAKLKLEDYRGSIPDFNKSIELNPNLADAYYNRGFAKLILGQKDSACLDFSKAGELGLAKAYELIKKYCNSNFYKYYMTEVEKIRK
jgi:tetratricopeptide (TPR) repeat protein